MQQIKQDSVFNSLYETIKPDLSIYSCNLITNVKAALDDIETETKKDDDYNKYDINFIDKKIRLIGNKIKENDHHVLEPIFSKILFERSKVQENVVTKRYLESKDVDLMNYYIVELSACLNLNLSLENYPASVIVKLYRDIYSSLLDNSFVDQFKTEKRKGK